MAPIGGMTTPSSPIGGEVGFQFEGSIQEVGEIWEFAVRVRVVASAGRGEAIGQHGYAGDRG